MQDFSKKNQQLLVINYFVKTSLRLLSKILIQKKPLKHIKIFVKFTT